MKKYSLIIAWGTDGDVTQTYNFNTEAERDAFLYGVEQCDGWFEYEILDSFVINTILL